MTRRLLIWLLLSCPAFAACTTGGSGFCEVGSGKTYTTIGACLSAMANGQTCLVFAGDYTAEGTLTVTAGGVGSYKTLTVNGSDIVSIRPVILNSHTKLIGNCPEKQGTVTTATCGFFISNPSSPGSAACIALSTNTDIYVIHNVMYACGAGTGNGTNTGGPSISSSTGSSFLYIQGNTISYPATTSSTNPMYTGLGMLIKANNALVENNDLSHYTLGIKYESNSNDIFRNNSFHDQFETEASANQHTDIFFSEPGIVTNTQFNVMEGNYQRNATGPNSKGPLSQNESCGSSCFNIIIRFNTVSRIGSGWITNDKTWPNVKAYNNTYVDLNSDGSTTFGAGNYGPTASNASYLNEIYYYTQASITDYNPYACNNTDCDYGHNLYWCTGTCTTIHGHTYGSGTFLGDTGNKNQNPLFVSYVSAGNAANDYHLQAGSPARNAGTNLTTVNGSVSNSTTLVVNDAAYFQDGYSLSNPYTTVQGDCIAVTSITNKVCITSVNYTTNTLTLASPTTATNGDPVWLYSKSDGVQVLTDTTGPDMGAFPFNATPPAPAAALFARGQVTITGQGSTQ